jgi:hypothetical protein
MIDEADAKHQPGITKGDVPHGPAMITYSLKGQLMKKYAKTLIALTFLLGLGVAAKAETRTEVIAKLPFQFVVDGKTLPAGTYTVRSLSANPYGVLLLTNNDNTTSMFVLPVSIAEPSSDKPKVAFKQVGEHYSLSSIQTEDIVYNFKVARSPGNVTAAKSNATVSVPASAGGN